MSKITLDQDEKIVLRCRRHWYFLFLGIGRYFLSALAPLFFYAALVIFTPSLITAFFNQLWGIFFLFWFGLTCFFLRFWLDYYLDLWVVTTKRIFDIEQRGLFSRDVSIFNLANVQDVSVDVHGALATFLNFGEVQVQTAGEARAFIFHQVPNPYRVQKTIINLSHRSPDLLKIAET
ncbi:MAG: hypothetical protein COU85_02845 [Candidatus Portnoybacteria bacterium CG10_big_fil_rev_8_21_14_0_10_44_7]|uniref:YdbS-like PH domain-containing protein n=1 Tax=Candidatus Portnoybacteria bacterium CG10_big_fil_rev_8_21_14_0_10_44_7 TaxID=1974816 RepID=A0A2M8KI38_9BACT|nr:MAG: hypothetical protein COU85_02845 [Candidatus Portnoybacteria bacterium CG10_big_fil_rev_8_21_14_0_10_44_7]